MMEVDQSYKNKGKGVNKGKSKTKNIGPKAGNIKKNVTNQFFKEKFHF